MSYLQKQMKLNRDLTALGSAKLRELVELAGLSTAKYLEMNEEFAQRIPESSDYGAWMTVQREYGEAAWAAIEAHVKARSEIIKEGFEQSSEIVRAAFAPEAEADAADVDEAA